jgi:hypothetical protein
MRRPTLPLVFACGLLLYPGGAQAGGPTRPAELQLVALESCLQESASCDLQALTPKQRNLVTVILSERNYLRCLEDKPGCNRDALKTGGQHKQVVGADANRNFTACLNSSPRCRCDQLTPDQDSQVQRLAQSAAPYIGSAELSQPYQTCAFSNSDCDPFKLPSDVTARLEAEKSFRACRRLGLESPGCDLAKLTQVQRSELQHPPKSPQTAPDQYSQMKGFAGPVNPPSGALSSTKLARNFQACAFSTSECEPSKLTPEQQARLEYDRNYRACYRLGLEAPGCDLAKLTEGDRTRLRSSAYPPAGTTTSKTSTQPSIAPSCAENDSCRGDISEATGRPKTVYVHGHYRKDGAYVRSHYRSKPRH